MKNVNVLPSKNLIKILKEAKDIVGTKELAKISRFKENSIRHWWSGKRTIPFNLLKVACELTGKNVWNEIDNHLLMVKGGEMEKTILFKKDIDTVTSYILGWIITDGHLTHKNEITITQKYRKVLEILGKKIKNIFLYKGCLSIQKHESQFGTGHRLRINSSAMQFILSRYYGVPIGNKFNIVQVPKQILESKDEEVKKAFLCAVFEADGSFSYYTDNNFRYPRLHYTSGSKKLINQIYMFCKNFNYSPNPIHPKKNSNAFYFEIKNLEGTLRIYFDIFIYQIHPKFQQGLDIFSDNLILDKIRIFSPQIVKLAINKVGTQEKLRQFLNQMNISIVNRKSISDWLYKKRITLRTYLTLCDLLKIDYMEFLPDYFSILLYCQKLISYKELMKIRYHFSLRNTLSVSA